MGELKTDELTAMIKSGDLKGSFLLYGEEQFLVSRYGRNIRKTVASSNEVMNATRLFGSFQDNGKAVTDIVETARTMPFFADRRVVEVSNSGFFNVRGGKKKDSKDDGSEGDNAPAATGVTGPLNTLVSGLPETCVLLFEETEIDKRSSLYKQILKSGHVIEFPRLKGKALFDKAAVEAKRIGLNIEASALRELISYTGNDLWTIVREFEKLKGYCADSGSATVSDVRDICTRKPEDKVFDMIEYMSSGRKMEAMTIYRDLAALGQNGYSLLSLIARDYNLLLSARDAIDRNLNKVETERHVNCMKFLVGKYVSRARHGTRAEFIQGLERCVQMQQDINTGRMIEDIGVEILIMEA
ncbi:MAG: DNA polymerase III subunit delta [Lachnospiraceae bacterium]|nr:DNA polymerase III subunit delta [Lachnospiraceae bacterium]